MNPNTNRNPIAAVPAVPAVPARTWDQVMEETRALVARYRADHPDQPMPRVPGPGEFLGALGDE